MENNSQIASLCTEENLVHSKTYSDIYRAEFTLNGLKRKWDIEKISIPFSPEKEQAYKLCYGVSDEDMPNIYKNLRIAMRQHLEINQSINAKAREVREKEKEAIQRGEKLNQKDLKSEKLIQCTKFYAHRDLFTIDNHIEMYIVSTPIAPLIGSDLFNATSTELINVVTLGLRLIRASKLYSDSGFHAGSYDLENISLSEVPMSTDAMHETRKFMQVNGFHMGIFEDVSNPQASILLRGNTPNFSTFMKPEIKAGLEQPSLAGDIYSVCAIMWSLLNGNYYLEAPDLQHKPIYSFDELTEQLLNGLNAEKCNPGDITKHFQAILNKIKNDPSLNKVIPIRKPQFIDEIERIKQEKQAELLRLQRESEEQAKKAEEALAESNKAVKKKKKIKKVISVAAIFIALIFGSAFVTALLNRSSPPMATPTPEIDSPEETEIPDFTTPEPSPELPTASSAEAGLYLFQKVIVDANGSVSNAHKLDSNGNITDLEGKVVVASDKVENYTYLNVIRLGKTSYDLQLVSQEDGTERGVISINVAAGPSSATSSLVKLALSGEGEVYFPYSLNKDCLSKAFADAVEKSIEASDDLNRDELGLRAIELDFAKSNSSNSIEVYIFGKAEGLYDLTASDCSGKTHKTSTINVFKEVVATPSPTPIPTPVPTPVHTRQPAQQYQPYPGSSSGSSSGSNYGSSIGISPQPTQEPLPMYTQPPQYEEPSGIFFIVNGQFLAKHEITLSVGDLYYIFPSESCTWGCTNPSVASIDSNGAVKAYAPGFCIITAYSANGTAEIHVTVV